MRSIGVKTDGLKLVKSEKKMPTINSSEQIKFQSQYTPMESVKDNLGNLKFKKLKSPFKANKSPEVKMSQPQKTEFMSQKDKTIKTKVKNKSVSVSSKKSSKSKALSSNKTLTRRKGESKNELKVYTSTNFNPKKK